MSPVTRQNRNGSQTDLVTNDTRRYDLFQILEFHCGRLQIFASSSRRLNSSRLEFRDPYGDGAMWFPSVLSNRAALEDCPSCSARVKPAPGTYSRASFSDGSVVKRNSPVPLGSHKFQLYVLANPLNIVVSPIFESVGLRFTTALIERAVVVLPLRVAFERIGLAVHDVRCGRDRFSNRRHRKQMLVGIGDPPIILYLFNGLSTESGSGMRHCPELLDELLALFVGLQAEKLRSASVMM